MPLFLWCLNILRKYLLILPELSTFYLLLNIFVKQNLHIIDLHTDPSSYILTDISRICRPLWMTISLLM